MACETHCAKGAGRGFRGLAGLANAILRSTGSRPLGITLALALAMQVSQASVVGVVRDRITGAELPGAVVALADLDRRVVTDAAGRYEIRDVPPGPHHLSVEVPGFEPRTLHALVPRAGRLEVNLTLTPDPVYVGAVEARTRVPVPHSGDAGTERGSATSHSLPSVRNHPLVAEADAFAALGGGEVYVHPESPSGVLIQGGTADQTGYELDGIPIFSASHAAGLFSAWNPDALSAVGVDYRSEVSQTLSGVVRGVTKTPGTSTRGSAALSTTQSRLTLDGPLGIPSFGYVFSTRSGRTLRKRSDENYLGGESGDFIGKVEGDLAGGRLRALVFQSENEIDIASEPEAPAPRQGGPPRSLFEWQGSSIGGSWIRPLGSLDFTLSGWQAKAGATGAWASPETPSALRSRRIDRGVHARVAGTLRGASLLFGLRGTSLSTEYRGAPEGESADQTAQAMVRTVGAFGEVGLPLGPIQVEAGGALTRALGRFYTAPRLGLQWRHSPRWSVFAEASRRQQLTHSLRTRESPAAGLLPTPLWVVSGEALPPAKSEQVTVGAIVQPLPGVQLRSTAFARRLEGFAQASGSNATPFATGSVQTGDASALGFSLDAGVSASRYGIVAGYGWQRLRYRVGDIDYQPSHGSAHRGLAGITFFATPTLSLRLGGTGEWGRTTTGFDGGLEWEACNLRDYGCEFGGTPALRSDLLGGVRLPDYLRIDLGVRKHWHVRAGPVEGAFELYGTLSNLFGRENVLNFGIDPESGVLSPITMLPRGPLLVGAEWRF